jgi:hypothetical protein
MSNGDCTDSGTRRPTTAGVKAREQATETSRHPAFGKVTTNDAPRVGLFSAAIVPPCASTMRFEMLRPRP